MHNQKCPYRVRPLMYRCLSTTALVENERNGTISASPFQSYEELQAKNVCFENSPVTNHDHGPPSAPAFAAAGLLPSWSGSSSRGFLLFHQSVGFSLKKAKRQAAGTAKALLVYYITPQSAAVLLRKQSQPAIWRPTASTQRSPLP